MKTTSNLITQFYQFRRQYIDQHYVRSSREANKDFLRKCISDFLDTLSDSELSMLLSPTDELNNVKQWILDSKLMPVIEEKIVEDMLL